MTDALRVSATDLDAYRRFRSNEDADLADLIAQLRRELPPTEPMLAGTALHAALETADPGAEFEQMEAHGYTFDVAFDGEFPLPVMREMKAPRDYLVGGVVITLVGKVDAVHGRTVVDHKFTARYDAERFLNSYQWRVYLEVFGADEFVWNVFEGREIAPKHYTLTALHHLRTHRYPGMGEDVRHELALFLDFAKTHLPERVKAWEPEPWQYMAMGG